MLPSWVWVGGLTVAGVAAVTVLAVQAADGPMPEPTAAHATSSAPASGSGSGPGSGKGGSSAHESPKPSAPAAPKVPAASGTGTRVVYALGEKRIWLVTGTGTGAGAADTPQTFPVWPGTVSPDPGSYTVSKGADEVITGSDGVLIEHVVYFAQKSDLSIAFSNAVDGARPSPSLGKPTSGIRMSEQAGTALWAFTKPGTKVVVVE